MYCINSLFEMKYTLTSICKPTRYLNCLMYTYIIRVFAISINNPPINNIIGGTVCNLRFFFFFFFFSFSVAGALARAFEIKNRNCAKKVLCYRKTDISVYDNFSREYLSQIASGNVCKNGTLQNIKSEWCGYFLIIGKLIIFHDSLRQ